MAIDCEERCQGLLRKSQANWQVGDVYLQKAKETPQDSHALNVAASRIYYGVLEAVIAFAVKHRDYVYDPQGESVHVIARRLVAKVMKNRGAELSSFADEFDALKSYRARADYEENDVEACELNDDLLRTAQVIRENFVREARKAVRGSGKGR